MTSARAAAGCAPREPRLETRHEAQRPQPGARARTGITRGEAIANVQLDANGLRLVASITVEAADELGLADGDEVVAIVKASDVMIGKR